MKKFLFASSILILAACGSGGNGGGNPPVQMPPTTNSAPQITSAGTATVTENNQTVFTVGATDPDGNNLTFSISGGADANQFQISNAGALTFASEPNFELPTDANLDNVYDVTVSVSDGMATVTQNITITVENDKEGISVRLVASGLLDVTSMAAVTSSPDLLIARRTGEIMLFSADTEAVSLERRVSATTGGEKGLLGIAFNPLRTRTFYVAFTYAAPDGNGGTANVLGLAEALRLLELTRVSNLTAETAPPITSADTDYGFGLGPDSSARGALAFDPSGTYAFVSVGDGNPIDEGAQVLSLGRGKIHRLAFNLDPFAGASRGPAFLIPNDNPYLRFGPVVPSIYSLGVQNPQSLFFNGNNLIFPDVGVDSDQELNVLDIDNQNANFGWPRFVGSELINETFRLWNNASDDFQTAPVTQYGQGDGDREGAKIIGGGIYAGSIESLQNKYIFADASSGKIWAIPAENLVPGETIDSNQYELLNADFEPSNSTIGNIVSFVVNGSDFYFADDNGNLYKVEPA